MTHILGLILALAVALAGGNVVLALWLRDRRFLVVSVVSALATAGIAWAFASVHQDYPVVYLFAIGLACWEAHTFTRNVGLSREIARRSADTTYEV